MIRRWIDANHEVVPSQQIDLVIASDVMTSWALIFRPSGLGSLEFEFRTKGQNNPSRPWTARLRILIQERRAASVSPRSGARRLIECVPTTCVVGYDLSPFGLGGVRQGDLG
jgi:hypothetical protein